MNMGKVSAIILIVILSLLLAINTDFLRTIISGDVDSIRALSGDSKFYILLITLIIMFVHNAFPVIPLFLVLLINNTFFGFQFGFAWSLLTSILCAVTVFLVIRHGFQSWVSEKVNPSLLHKIQRNGLWYVLGARIFPFAPTSIINGVSGISHIRLSSFMTATALGNFTLFTIYTLIQAGLVSQDLNENVIAGFLLAGIIVYFFIKKAIVRHKRAKRSISLPHKSNS